MSYHSIIVLEERNGARRRRKMAVECHNREHARLAIHELCRGTGFTPDFTTLDEVNRKKYERIITTFFGRNVIK